MNQFHKNNRKLIDLFVKREWNFVHPNSSKSKLRKTMESTDEMMTISNGNNKLLSRENIGKLIFTHMASFIVGATLLVFFSLFNQFTFFNLKV